MLTFNKNIGCFTVDRARNSCVHKTSYCEANCYNNIAYVRLHHIMLQYESKLENFWNTISGEELKNILDRKKLQTKRVRLCSRGEPVKTERDIPRIINFCYHNSNRIFSMYTRAWRNKKLRNLIERSLFNVENLRILASFDPSNRYSEFLQLKDNGWSTIYFGGEELLNSEFKCPKTWQNKHRHCVVCKNGCFSSKQVNIHLRNHGKPVGVDIVKKYFKQKGVKYA